MRTSGTCPWCTQPTNSLKLTCCFLSPGCNTCQIARNITIKRTQSRSVLCDCFTSTSLVPDCPGQTPRASSVPYTYDAYHQGGVAASSPGTKFCLYPSPRLLPW